MRKKRSIVVDILEVDLDVSVPHQTVAALVLGEDREPPLRSSIGLIPVERLQDKLSDYVILLAGLAFCEGKSLEEPALHGEFYY